MKSLVYNQLLPQHPERLMDFNFITRILYNNIYDDDDDDEIAYFTVRWKTRASFVYRTKNVR